MHSVVASFRDDAKKEEFGMLDTGCILHETWSRTSFYARALHLCCLFEWHVQAHHYTMHPVFEGQGWMVGRALFRDPYLHRKKLPVGAHLRSRANLLRE